MSFIDELIRITSAPVRLSPSIVTAPATVRCEAARLRTAVIRRCDAGAVELSPVVRSEEPDAGDAWGMRLAECCAVAEVLRESFGGEWHTLGRDVVYRPRAGSDIPLVERSARAAFDIRGMRAEVL